MNSSCRQLRWGAAMKVVGLGALALALMTPAAWAHRDTVGCTGVPSAESVTIFSDANCQVPAEVGFEALECDTISIQVRLGPLGAGDCAIEAGTWDLYVNDPLALGAPFAPLGAVPCVGGTFNDPNFPNSPNFTRGLCEGSLTTNTSACITYSITEQDALNGQVAFTPKWTGFVHGATTDIGNQVAQVNTFLSVATCDGEATECLGPDECVVIGGVAQCVQEPVPVSEPCNVNDGDVCSADHCDGFGQCVDDPSQDVSPPDATECESFDCDPTDGIVGCIPNDPLYGDNCVPLSTACNADDGDVCTADHCDGLGACVDDPSQDVIPPDATECESFDCDPTDGIVGCIPNDPLYGDNCVPLSTACNADDGDVCTADHCDGLGACVDDPDGDLDCNDGKVCTDDRCDPTDGCINDCAPDGKQDCEIDIGDYIWDDANQDGIQDGGEFGIDGVTVTLTDCQNIIASDVTGGGGIYTFSGIDIVDADCVPGPVDLEVVVDLNTLPAGLDNESPWQQGGDPALDSDCEAGVIACAAYGESTETLDCGFFEEPSEAVCRTPGFWGARGGSEKGGFNFTQAAIDAAGGTLDVCGQIVDRSNSDILDLGDLGHALEGICVNVRQGSHVQLYRQLVAGALNCASSGSYPSCSVIPLLGVTWAECNAACVVGGAADPSVVQSCIDQIDCFNNGGEYGAGGCVLGTCMIDGFDCGGDAPDCDFLDDGFGENANYCAAFADNCHDRDFCESSLVFPDDSDLCYKHKRNSSPRACHAASRNDCTIHECP